MDSKKDLISYKTNKKTLDKKGCVSSAKGHHESISGTKKDVANTINSDVSFSVFLNKKTEKLTSALYMVTSFLSDKEPIKWKLREKGIELLSGISNVRNNSTSEVDNIFADYVFAIEEIVFLLEIAVSSKLISEMNFSILKKEYVYLEELLSSEEYAGNRIGRFVFPNNFFTDTDSGQSKRFINNIIQTKDVSDIQAERADGIIQTKGQVKITSTDFANKVHDASQRHKTTQHSVSDVKRTQTSTRTFKDIRVKKMNRRDSILKMFKKNKELTIKDIASEVSGCSEKTIQRELSALVLKGILNKKGERRWSRYSLK